MSYSLSKSRRPLTTWPAAGGRFEFCQNCFHSVRLYCCTESNKISHGGRRDNYQNIHIRICIPVWKCLTKNSLEVGRKRLKFQIFRRFFVDIGSTPAQILTIYSLFESLELPLDDSGSLEGFTGWAPWKIPQFSRFWPFLGAGSLFLEQGQTKSCNGRRDLLRECLSKLMSWKFRYQVS